MDDVDSHSPPMCVVPNFSDVQHYKISVIDMYQVVKRKMMFFENNGRSNGSMDLNKTHISCVEHN
jgi:hypothetical protein